MRKLIILMICSGLLLLGLLLYTYPEPQPLKIGVFQYANTNATTLSGFKQGLEAAGLRENQEVVYLFDGPVQKRSELNAAAGRLLAEQPDLIFTSTTPATRIIKELTAELAPGLPVVFAPVNDPVASAVVANLQQPEANLTGVRLSLSEGRRLQALCETFPGVKTIWIPFSPNNRAAEASLVQLHTAAEKLRLKLITFPFKAGSSQEEIRAMIPADVDALLLPRDSQVMARSRAFISAAIERKLPLSAARFSQAEAGALTGYGFVGTELGKQAARLAIQLLHGIPVASLPVETARDYLFFNLDTAAMMDLTLPSAALRRAHFLIQQQQTVGAL